MILDRDDPHRGRCGHHHDRHRSAGDGSSCTDLVRRCCVLVGNAEEDRNLLAQAEYLAASFEAKLTVADLRPERDRCAFPMPSIAGLLRCLHKLSWHDRDAFLRVARSSDVVIVDDGRADAAAELATLSGRPFLTVPASLAAESLGSRVVIFSTERGCSAAALRDVLPWLRDAYAITVVGEQDLHTSTDRIKVEDRYARANRSDRCQGPTRVPPFVVVGLSSRLRRRRDRQHPGRHAEDDGGDRRPFIEKAHSGAAGEPGRSVERREQAVERASIRSLSKRVR